MIALPGGFSVSDYLILEEQSDFRYGYRNELAFVIANESENHR